jgi:hypothetical protein
MPCAFNLPPVHLVIIPELILITQCIDSLIQGV